MAMLALVVAVGASCAPDVDEGFQESTDAPAVTADAVETGDARWLVLEPGSEAFETLLSTEIAGPAGEIEIEIEWRR